MYGWKKINKAEMLLIVQAGFRVSEMKYSGVGAWGRKKSESNQKRKPMKFARTNHHKTKSDDLVKVKIGMAK
jgi:hypothetical protein